MQRKIIYLIIGSIVTLACQVTKVSQTISPVSDDNISYKTTIKPIIQNYCISCHSGTKPAAGMALTSYEEVRFQTKKGKLLNRINNEGRPMPKSGLMPLEMRLSIEKWAKNGFKQNVNTSSDTTNNIAENNFIPPVMTPIDISKQGFDFFDLMQGHWVGNMLIMGQKFDWFSFDYRPISPSHIHGIYEGGTIGNLFTSFFIANFKGTKTIVARNGGILNGIYRTSYFILDKVEFSNKRKYFRLVDAYGGKDIMWMELEFIGNKLRFNSYTSRFGLNGKPKLHMKFKASKKHIEISNHVAHQLDYPQNRIEKDFSNGLPTPNWGEEYATVTSASYIFQDTKEDLITLGKMAGDPYPINELPYLASLKVNIEQNEKIKNKDLIIYLSKDPLTDDNGNVILEYGYVKQSLFDGILSFPQLSPNQTAFTFHYLHPGNYYLTIVADINKDGYISKTDITSKSHFVSVSPQTEEVVIIKNITLNN